MVTAVVALSTCPIRLTSWIFPSSKPTSFSDCKDRAAIATKYPTEKRAPPLRHDPSLTDDRCLAMGETLPSLPALAPELVFPAC